MILFIALLVWGFRLYRIWTESFSDWIENVMFSCLAAVVVGAVAGTLLAMSAHWEVEIKREECYDKIYSISNVNGTEGVFCLGSGYISSQEYYYMFEKYNDDGLHRITLRSTDSVVYQTENNSPYIHWQKIYYRLPYWAYFGPKTVVETANTMYDIHIPTNSVILKFNVN